MSNEISMTDEQATRLAKEKMMARTLCGNSCCLECDECAAKPGSPRLCDECLRRRSRCSELHKANANAKSYVIGDLSPEYVGGVGIAFLYLSRASGRPARIPLPVLEGDMSDIISAGQIEAHDGHRYIVVDAQDQRQRVCGGS